MAAKKLTEITMASALFLLLLLVPASSARYLSGEAIETLPGMMAIDGISPAPTEAPGLNGIPKELRNRAVQTFIETPPSSWCGFIDGNYQNILSCLPNTPCVQKSNFYGICCTSLYTESCLLSDVPTLCLDSTVWAKSTVLGAFTVACYDPIRPYCVTLTSGSSRSFGCASTTSPSIKSFVPVSAYYSSVVKTPLTTVPSTPTQTPATTILSSTPPTTISSTTISTPITSYASSPTAKPSKLSTPAVAGIGVGAGLATSGAIAAIVIFFWRKRKRERASPTAGGAGPDQAATNNGPQGYQSAAQPVEQYQPQADITKFPEPGDIPPYSPAPGYTSGGQQISNAPITSYDPNIASKYPSSTITTALPLSPNPSHSTDQQQNTATSWDYPPNSPNSALGPERSNLHHSDLPPNPSELSAREAQMHHTGSPWNYSELGAGIHYPGSPGNRSELGARIHHPSSPGNHSELSGTGIAGAHYPDHS